MPNAVIVDAIVDYFDVRRFFLVVVVSRRLHGLLAACFKPRALLARLEGDAAESLQQLVDGDVGKRQGVCGAKSEIPMKNDVGTTGYRSHSGEIRVRILSAPDVA